MRRRTRREHDRPQDRHVPDPGDRPRARRRTNATDKPSKRSIIATLRRKSFIDFLYFTDFETLDPYAYRPRHPRPDLGGHELRRQVPPAAQRPAARIPTSSRTDSVDGPFKTNDSISVCGTPTFGRDANDAIELNGASPGWVSGCSGSSPNFKGTVDWPAGALPMPQSNSELEAAADAGYVFDGETKIVFNGTTMSVTNNGTTVTKNAAAERRRLRQQHDRLQHAGYSAPADLHADQLPERPRLRERLDLGHL